jgi:hypothetical protein
VYIVILQAHRGNQHIKECTSIVALKAHIKAECSTGAYQHVYIYDNDRMVLSIPVHALPRHGYEIH